MEKRPAQRPVQDRSPGSGSFYSSSESRSGCWACTPGFADAPQTADTAPHPAAHTTASAAGPQYVCSGDDQGMDRHAGHTVQMCTSAALPKSPGVAYRLRLRRAIPPVSPAPCPSGLTSPPAGEHPRSQDSTSCGDRRAAPCRTAPTSGSPQAAPLPDPITGEKRHEHQPFRVAVLPWWATAAAAGLVLAACGGHDSTSTTATPGTLAQGMIPHHRQATVLSDMVDSHAPPAGVPPRSVRASAPAT